MMAFLIFMPPQSSLNGRERNPCSMNLGKTQGKRKKQLSGSRSSVPLAFLSDTFGTAPTLEEKNLL